MFVKVDASQQFFHEKTIPILNPDNKGEERNEKEKMIFRNNQMSLCSFPLQFLDFQFRLLPDTSL